MVTEKKPKFHLRLSSKEWTYRGEGNANVVLALPKHRKILRIRKTEKPKTLFEWLIDFLIRYLTWTDVCDTENKNEVGITKLKTILEHIISRVINALSSNYKSIIYREIIDLKFYKRIIRPLLGFNFTCDATSVYVSEHQISEIEDVIRDVRPENRKNKRLSYGKATLFDDFSLLPLLIESRVKPISPTFAIEIKPKQGWFPVTEQKFSKCLFCLKQHLKLQRGQVNSISSYCPMDLFSGDKSRNLKAINALISNPQNNFKIFNEGMLLYGEDNPTQNFENVLPEIFGDINVSCNELKDDFCHFVQAALTRKLNKSTFKCNHRKEKTSDAANDYSSNTHRKSSSNILNDNSNNLNQNSNIQNRSSNVSIQNSNILHQNSLNGCFSQEDCVLPEGCVLDKILSLQKLNQEGLYYYQKLLEARKVNESNDWSYVEEALSNMDVSLLDNCPKCVTSILKKKSDIKSDINCLAFLPFLLFAIARDCSLMITFRRISENVRELQDCIVETRHGLFVINVGVFDLYPKPISTIKKSVNRNAKIFKTYQSILGDKL